MRIEINYAFYVDEYGGSTIKEKDFKLMTVKAEAVVNEMTFNRIRQHDLAEDDERAVKLAICAAAEVFQANKGREGIASEVNDGYHTTFETSRSLKQRVASEAYSFLQVTGLMNRGTNYDYECRHNSI